MAHSTNMVAVEIERETHHKAKIAAITAKVQLRDWVAEAIRMRLANEGAQPSPATKPPRESLRLQHGPDGSVLGPKADKKAAAKKPDPNPNADLDAMPNPFAD